MTSPLRSSPVPLLAAAVLASALLASSPGAAAVADQAEHAVAACRAELMSRFTEGEIRSHRVTSIAGNSRRTRISIVVNADRRYVFECATGRDGSVELASFDPPRSADRRLASDQR
jgi:hypothetical protein